MRTNRIDATTAERAAIIQLRRDDHDERWTRTAVADTLADIPPLAVDKALGLLADAGAVVIEGEIVQASACARHLDALGLIAI